MSDMIGELVSQQYELVPVESLTPHPMNPRRGNVDALVDSIDVNGFYGAVVAQRSTRHVLAGNHRLLAARELNVETLPVIWLDVDDERAARILLVDNRLNDLATYDERELIDLLHALGDDLQGTGYDENDLAELLRRSTPGSTDPAAEWEGMPEYDNDKIGYQTISVHFRTAADRDAFAQLVAQKITDQTKYVWFPTDEPEQVNDLAYVAADDDADDDTDRVD